MDSYKEFYIAINPAARSIKMGDTSGRKNLRKDLKCRGMCVLKRLLIKD